MSKRLTNLLMLFGAIAITVTTVSFSYFYFGGNISVNNQETVDTLKTDDIYENYKSIKQEEGDIDFDDQTYDIYIFPSAEYIQIYNQYIEGVEALFNSYMNDPSLGGLSDDEKYKKAKEDQNTNSLNLITDPLAPVYTPLYKPLPEDFNGSLRLEYSDNGQIKRDPKKPDEPVTKFESEHLINNTYQHSNFNRVYYDQDIKKNCTPWEKFRDYGHPLDEDPATEINAKTGQLHLVEATKYPADMYVQYLNENYLVPFTRSDLFYHADSGAAYVVISPDDKWSSKPFPFYASLKENSIILKDHHVEGYPDPYYEKVHLDGLLGTSNYTRERWNGDLYWDKNIMDVVTPKTVTSDTFHNYRIAADAGYQRNVYQIYRYYATKYSDTYRTYGDPADKSFSNTPNMDPQIEKDFISLFTKRDGANSPTFPDRTSWGDEINDCDKPLFADDRFGAWKNLSMVNGRFSPIHIRVNNSISPQIFNSAFGELFTSMNDGNKNPWFEQTFSNFVYAKTESYMLDNVSHKYVVKRDFPIKNLDDFLLTPNDVQSRDLISGYDNNKVFDITKSLSNYADENNVIRLFPTFSSGKGYYSQGYLKTHSGVDAPKVARLLGGKDQVNIITTQTFQGGTKEFKMAPQWISTYKENHDQGVDPFKAIPVYNDYSIYCAYLAQIPINIFTVHTTLKVSVHIANGPGNWQGNKLYPYEIDFKSPEGEKLLKGSGYYNIYLFVGDSGWDCDAYTSPPTTAPANIDGFFDTENNTTNNYLTGFDFLNNKRLIKVPCTSHNGFIDYYDSAKGAPAAKDKYGKGNFINQRPIYMMLEKAVEPKIFMDFDMSVQDKSDIDQNAYQKHDIAPTGYNFNRPTFIIDDQNKAVQVYKGPNIENTLRSKNNFYVFKNVDFTDSVHHDFQIRFGHEYDKSIKINPKPKYKNIYMQKSNNKVYGIPSPEELNNNQWYLKFWPAFNVPTTDPNDPIVSKGNFMSLKVKKTNINGQEVDMQYLSLNSPEHHGVYDIVLIQSEDSTDPNNPVFDIYTYRHTNIFVKIFKDNPTKMIQKEIGHTGQYAEFVDHVNSPGLLFEKKCFIGDLLDEQERSDRGPMPGSSISEIIAANINSWNPNFDPKDPNSKTTINFKNLVIRDRVTNAPIIWYNQKAGAVIKTEADLLDPNKFEIFYDPTFPIFKNLILYVSSTGKLEGSRMGKTL